MNSHYAGKTRAGIAMGVAGTAFLGAAWVFRGQRDMRDLGVAQVDTLLSIPTGPSSALDPTGPSKK